MAHFIAFIVAVYCYALAIHTYLRQEPLAYFYKAGLLLSKLIQMATLRDKNLAFQENIQGVRTGLIKIPQQM
jgi:hypothetical protein